MIVMDLKLDNFFSFKNFHMNMSYPKKIVDSYIEDEFLKDRTNFRYKKVNILMGGNASGKTSVGKALMSIFNFIDSKELNGIVKNICNKSQAAFFSIDFATEDYKLYRVNATILPKKDNEYKSTDIKLTTKVVEIRKNDSYASCVKRILEMQNNNLGEGYVDQLDNVEGLSWLFAYPTDGGRLDSEYENYPIILDYTLRALDPSIKVVEKISEVENSYVIRMLNQDIVIQDGQVIKNNILSSGTMAGIDIAYMLSSIKEGANSFYYCDEKFSYIHSDIEKAFLVVMINSLKENDQLFFTTHNSDVLDLPLPKHSFTFLKKDLNNEDKPIDCINASGYLKRNTDSLRNAVDNDLFSAAPNVELIYEIEEL